MNPTDRIQQVWGVWGRSTGFLTYFALTVLAAGAYLAVSDLFLSKFLRAFTLTSYFITFYTVIQFADLDPINWSQKLPIATLGNINFTSSFLGLSIVLFMSRIILEPLSVTAKIHFSTVSALNMFLILGTGSIQGLAVAAGGFLTAFFIRTFNSKGWKSAVAICFPIASVGFFVFISTAGWGPLGNQLKQLTVLYRIDYWVAGWNMFTSSPIWGLGLDSYGDYYREFRSIEAAETGPTRITNTAHNIFLDLLSGGGLVLFLPMLFMILFSLHYSIRGSVSKSQNTDYPVYLIPPLIVGWLIFANISIGQIGLTSWGFVLFGLGLRASLIKKFNSNQSQNRRRRRVDSNEFSKGTDGILSSYSEPKGKSDIFPPTQLMTISLFLGLGLYTGLLPNLADARLLSAVKQRDVQAMQAALELQGSMNFHAERVALELVNMGLNSEASAISRDLLIRNPRSFQSLVTLATDAEASIEERKSAIRKLIQIDPNNPVLKEDIKKLGL